MKSLLLLGSLLLMATSCVDYDGSFYAKESLKFKHSNIFGYTRIKKLNPGQYKTSFVTTVGRKLKFTFKGPNNLDIKIDLPHNVYLPSRDGEFTLLAEETKQFYDIKGSLNTNYSSSSLRSAVEKCSYETRERQCREVCNPLNGSTEGRSSRGSSTAERRPSAPSARRGERCRQECSIEVVQRSGRQHVRYRINYTDRFLELSMLRPDSSKQVARYEGHDKRSSRSYEYRGACLKN